MSADRKDQPTESKSEQINQISDQGQDVKELDEIDKKLMLKNRIINLSLLIISCSFVFFVWILTHSDYYENNPEAANPILEIIKSAKDWIIYLLKA